MSGKTAVRNQYKDCGDSAEIKHEFLETDPMILVESKKTTIVEKELAMTKDSADKVITALLCLPGGIQKMSFQMKGLVKTSLNLGIMKTERDHVSLSFSVRSSVESEKRALLDQIACLTKTLGGTVTAIGDYPAWEYLENSPLRDLMCRIFEEQYGRKPIVEALHAGVECGIFAGKIPELDCVSFGPDMKDIHTPKESMDVESVKRTWEYLLEILKQPLFMAYRDRQPFNENHLRPCPMLENPEILQQMVKETGAKSTDLQSPEDVTHLCGKCEEYARKWKPCAERLWAEEKHKKHSYENYKKK